MLVVFSMLIQVTASPAFAVYGTPAGSRIVGSKVIDKSDNSYMALECDGIDPVTNHCQYFQIYLYTTSSALAVDPSSELAVKRYPVGEQFELPASDFYRNYHTYLKLDEAEKGKEVKPFAFDYGFNITLKAWEDYDYGNAYTVIGLVFGAMGGALASILTGLGASGYAEDHGDKENAALKAGISIYSAIVGYFAAPPLADLSVNAAGAVAQGVDVVVKLISKSVKMGKARRWEKKISSALMVMLAPEGYDIELSHNKFYKLRKQIADMSMSSIKLQ